MEIRTDSPKKLKLSDDQLKVLDAMLDGKRRSRQDAIDALIEMARVSLSDNNAL